MQEKQQPQATLNISNCMDCPFHKVLADPDPDDWFCDDDVRVYCTKANQNITTACRPYNTRNESEVPTWCPLLTTSNPTHV